ncbi:MAG: hypothetical protein GDA36_04545 [Rhodobacteraceae bacterium]|nr:hypothetical protein [Paracoccaceae bacterium]
MVYYLPDRYDEQDLKPISPGKDIYCVMADTLSECQSPKHPVGGGNSGLDGVCGGPSGVVCVRGFCQGIINSICFYRKIWVYVLRI